ncbi:MAG: hypothetical protein FJ217_01705 [Ignavibacteria bacterium]|nr:hypothetical protein [Ignavibacteria bacterium]
MVSRLFAMMCLCTMWSVTSLVSQVLDRSGLLDKSLESRAIQSMIDRDQRTIEALKGFPMEGPIDPSAYIVGPSDIFQIAVSGPTILSFSVPVTPEGRLIVPTVGDADVQNRRLTDVKQQVHEMIRKKYPVGDITVALLKPRSFIVTLRGAVLKQGQYIAGPIDRVEKVLIDGASSVSPTPTAAMPVIPPEASDPLAPIEAVNLPKVNYAATIYERASTRNITLIRRTRDTLHVDIPKFYATGEDRYNPFLLDGDVILVPERNLAREFVAIYGAVNAPGRYEFVEGDDLLDIVQLAQGLTKSADSGRVIISRLDKDAEGVEEIAVSLKEAPGMKAPYTGLQRGDRILVKSVADERKNYTVFVAGEVKVPGIYPISRSSTRLSKILADAGGVTDNALLNGSVLMRKDDRMKDLFDPQLELLRHLRSQQITSADSAYFSLDIKLARHPVIVDFVKLIEGQDTTQDIFLRHEDVVYIAANHRTVLVQGQVANPGYVPHVPGAGFAYYIQRAGGFSELAIADDARIIKKGTLEWIEPEKTSIEVGDQIWVPKKPIRDFSHYISVFRDVISATAALATAVILAIQVSRQ